MIDLIWEKTLLKNRQALPFVKWTGGLGFRAAPKRLLKQLGI